MIGIRITFTLLSDYLFAEHFPNILSFYCIKYDFFPYLGMFGLWIIQLKRGANRENRRFVLCNGIGYPSAPVISINFCESDVRNCERWMRHLICLFWIDRTVEQQTGYREVWFVSESSIGNNAIHFFPLSPFLMRIQNCIQIKWALEPIYYPIFSILCI